jgi:predicted regulator of Ras-like GTPase activity (Roadblock/LC7/MglB family)
MPFKRLLSRLIDSVEGAQGAIVADWEGEAVDQVARIDDFEIKVIGAHQGVLLGHFRKVVKALEGNDLEEIVVSTEQTQTLIVPISADYFLVFVMDRGDALLGRALFETRRCAKALQSEVAC